MKVGKSVLLSKAVLGAAFMYTVVALVCTQVPLLNYLGFEFSFVIALVGSFISAFVTISLIKPSFQHANQASFHSSIFPSFLSSLFAGALLLLIPLAIILVNAFFVRNCSIPEGLAFFVLLPVVSVWFSSCLGLFALVHYRHSRTVVVLVILASIGYAASLGYFTPAIFSYNFFYGFFPGLSYDELLTISWTLVLFRLITVAAGALLLWFTHIMVQTTIPSASVWTKGVTLLRALLHPGRAAITILLMCAAGLLYMFRCELGFESTAAYIQATLGGKVQTSHFTIYYSPDASTRDEIQCLATDHEFYFRQISSALGLASAEPITSYVYPSSASKQRLIGTGNTNIAKPWSREIHLTRQSVDATLKHEMIHVLVGDFGVPVVRASWSTGLVEGVAMALENKPGNRTLHEYAAAMRHSRVSPDIRRLMTPTGFMSQSSSVSYILAGSLCRDLIDRYGIAPLLMVYRTGDYERVYKVPLDTLVRRWNMTLDTISVRESDSGMVDVFFRSRPIFGKVCPRVLARRMRTGERLFAERDYRGAFAAYEDVYQDGRGMDAFRGMMASFYRMWKFKALTTAVDSLIHTDDHPLRYLTLNLLAGDAFWAQGDTAEARTRYAALERTDLTDGYTEAALVRQRMLGNTKSPDRFLSYLYGDRNDSARVVMLDSLTAVSGDTALCRYLQGRALHRLGRWDTSIHALHEGKIVPEIRFLEYLRLRTMGECCMRLGRLDEAMAAFASARTSASRAQQAIDIREWTDRCTWMSSNDSR
jgi:hypothetical protein